MRLFFMRRFLVASLLLGSACDSELFPSTPKRDAENSLPDASNSEELPWQPDQDKNDAGPPLHGVETAWCRALLVLQTRCGSCHGASRQAGAPMSLANYDDMMKPAVTAPEKKVFELVASRIYDHQAPMPPSGVLDVAELAPLDAWLASDREVGSDPTCVGLPEVPPPVKPETLPWPDDCEAFYSIRAHDPDDPSKPFRIPAGQEIQVPLAIDVPPWGDVPTQALMFKPIIDNIKVLHHWNLFEGAAGSADGAMLWGFAPGNQGTPVIPNDVGLYLPSGPMNLEMHYYNVGGTEDEFDETGIEVCVTRTFRKHTASLTKHFNAFPLLAPHQQGSAQDICRVITTTDEPIHLIGVIPHMHKLGVRAFLSVNRNYTERVLLDVPYTFKDQRVHPMDDVLIHSGDVVTTRCTWNNTTGRLVDYGMSSDQEMCANFGLYWPMDGFFCLGL